MTNTLPDPTRTDPSLPAPQTPAPRPLRLWPAVMFVALYVLLRFGLPLVMDEAGAFVMLVSLVCGLGIVLWWLFFSRAPWLERLGLIVAMAAAMVAMMWIVHPSIHNGAMGMLPYVFTLPMMALAFGAAMAIGGRWAPGKRRAAMVAAIVLGCASIAVIRTEGMKGDGPQLHWRWTQTPEEKLLAQAASEPEPVAPPAADSAAAPASASPAGATETPASATPASAAPAPVASAPAPASPAASTPSTPATAADVASASAKPSSAPVEGGSPAATPAVAAVETRAAWPGFRGPERDGVVRGTRIQTDWTKSPPVEVWRRKIGPAWSSFAVRGNLLYTQEQRGEDEIVASYRLTSGAPVWRHRDSTRFWESNAGAGPRATPTLSGGRVYTLGGTGIVNVLDADRGAVIWSKNAASDADVKVPYWGFAGSPLIVDDLVVVAVAGRLVAYDRETGTRRWIAEPKGMSYSSPHLMTLGGVRQVVLLSDTGATSVALADGTKLWEHAWSGFTSLQPVMIADGDVLISNGGSMGGLGTRRLAVTHGPDGWRAAERWTSNGLKPYFNDLVVHKGYAYGFDGRILACIDLADGVRKWKGGRYGNGQLVLLPEQDLLIVLSEDGELALVSATSDGFKELARMPALEGKTWNHPVLVGDLLLVRNDQEMAAFRLSLASPE
jgi:outer membrane protein assembly factor BamB